MDSEAREKVESLCLEALSKEGPERAAFLDDACGCDAELRREVESLLGGGPEADELLETPSSTASGPPLTSGTRLGPYEIQSFTGAGGMGQVYKVRNLISDRVEAMKILLPNLEGDPDLADRFVREIKVQANVPVPKSAEVGLRGKIGRDSREGCLHCMRQPLKSFPIANLPRPKRYESEIPEKGRDISLIKRFDRPVVRAIRHQRNPVILQYVRKVNDAK